MIKLTLTFAVVFLVATFPATWLLMLFMGNVGMALGYWGAFPLGILVSSLIGGASASDLPFNPGPVQSGLRSIRAPFNPVGSTGSFRRFLARKFFN